ncbi:MAG: ABC-F family ATP-binding cassette domain-containing protein, partial [Chloroflexi bacterium]|nr:ABC-F family ATP-binding cassette domain-containing protein [Chloroflexota bacterium]
MIAGDHRETGKGCAEPGTGPDSTFLSTHWHALIREALFEPRSHGNVRRARLLVWYTLDESSMLSANAISKSFGDQVLFEKASFTIGPRDRIAMIGPNGSGKTTLFNILARRSQPDSGSLSIRKGTTVGFLEQDISPASQMLLLDSVLAGSTRVTGLSHRLQVIQEELAEAGAEEMDGLLSELGELQHRFEAAGGYDLEHEAMIVLGGLGFSKADFVRPVSQFSGGWLMRAE